MNVKYENGPAVEWLGLEEVPSPEALELNWYRTVYRRGVIVHTALEGISGMKLVPKESFVEAFYEASEAEGVSESETRWVLHWVEKILINEGLYGLDEADLAPVWVTAAQYIAERMPAAAPFGPWELTLYFVGRVIEELASEGR